MRTAVILILISINSILSQAVLDWNNYSSGNNNTIDELFSTAIDLQGNCYVIGTQNQKMRVIKYGNTGSEAWSKEFSGNFLLSSSFGSCITVDKYNDLIASGYGIDTSQSNNILLFKINKSTGDTIWSRHYNSSGFNIDITKEMEVDTLGNIYIAAEVKQNSNSSDYLILKYSSYGALLWKKTYSYSSKGVDFVDRIMDMKLDKNMNVYIFGFNTETLSIDSIRHNTVVKYNKDGVFQWAATYYLSSPQSEINAISVDADAQGNVYISGFKHPHTDEYYWEFYLIKYNSSGVKQWTIVYGGDAAEGFYRGGLIKLDNAGAIILTTAKETSIGAICKTFKYSPAGMLLWSEISVLNESNIPRKLEIKSNGEVYIGCVFADHVYENVHKTGVFKLSSWGITQWGVAYTGNGYGKELNDMKLFNNDIFLAGDEKLSSSWPSQCLTLKYAEAEERPQSSNENIPKYFRLSQNYPNPFNPTTMISYSIPESGNVKISVFDVTGRNIETLTDKNTEAGTYFINFDGSRLSSGVYFYKIEAGGFVDTKKMNLVK